MFVHSSNSGGMECRPPTQLMTVKSSPTRVKSPQTPVENPMTKRVLIIPVLGRARVQLRNLSDLEASTGQNGMDTAQHSALGYADFEFWGQSYRVLFSNKPNLPQNETVAIGGEVTVLKLARGGETFVHFLGSDKPTSLAALRAYVCIELVLPDLKLKMFWRGVAFPVAFVTSRLMGQKFTT